MGRVPEKVGWEDKKEKKNNVRMAAPAASFSQQLGGRH